MLRNRIRWEAESIAPVIIPVPAALICSTVAVVSSHYTVASIHILIHHSFSFLVTIVLVLFTSSPLRVEDP